MNSPKYDEKDGKFAEATNEIQAAAGLDSSEDDLFDWGRELLLRSTYDQGRRSPNEAERVIQRFGRYSEPEPNPGE